MGHKTPLQEAWHPASIPVCGCETRAADFCPGKAGWQSPDPRRAASRAHAEVCRQTAAEWASPHHPAPGAVTGALSDFYIGQVIFEHRASHQTFLCRRFLFIDIDTDTEIQTSAFTGEWMFLIRPLDPVSFGMRRHKTLPETAVLHPDRRWQALYNQIIKWIKSLDIWKKKHFSQSSSFIKTWNQELNIYSLLLFLFLELSRQTFCSVGLKN